MPMAAVSGLIIDSLPPKWIAAPTTGESNVPDIASGLTPVGPGLRTILYGIWSRTGRSWPKTRCDFMTIEARNRMFTA